MDHNQLHAIPTFRITDYREALSFYLDFLGLAKDWEHRLDPEGPVYMQVSGLGLALHLTEHERFPAGAVVYVATRDLAAFHQRLQQRAGRFPLPALETTPWHSLQLELTDPFGNLLRFNEAVG